MELARLESVGSPATIKRSLRAIWQSMELPLSAAYDFGYDLIVEHRGHPDAFEGAGAFLEKRDPKWSAP
jgi:enoyl-CoA hydratase/carnithine racemase